MTQYSQFQSVRFWVVSAWLPEQQFLRNKLASSMDESLKNEDICAVDDVGFLCTGVGSVRAAACVAHVIALSAQKSVAPEAVIFVGTAGCYSEQVALNSSHYCSEVYWSDGDLAEARSYLPDAGNGSLKLSCEPSLFSEVGLVAVSSPGITTHEGLADSLSHFGQLENLELFGVAQAARLAAVRWGAVLGVSNRVGTHSHKEWRENHLQASLSAQKMLFDGFLKGRLNL